MSKRLTIRLLGWHPPCRLASVVIKARARKYTNVPALVPRGVMKAARGWIAYDAVDRIRSKWFVCDPLRHRGLGVRSNCSAGIVKVRTPALHHEQLINEH
jgi:hypothetical protein